MWMEILTWLTYKTPATGFTGQSLKIKFNKNDSCLISYLAISL